MTPRRHLHVAPNPEPVLSRLLAAALCCTLAGAAGAQIPSNNRSLPSARDQGPVHEAWYQRDLKPGAQILGAVQGDDGYLWLATTSGLLRFDGARATKVRGPALDSLTGPYVLRVIKARDGAIWAGTLRRGLFRIAGDSVTHWTTDNGLPGQQVNALFQDTTGIMWVGTENGICWIHGSGCVPVGPAGFRALALGAGWDGSLLVGSYGLFQLRGDSLSPIPVLNPALYRVTRITRGVGHTVWVSTVAGLVELLPPSTPGGLPRTHILTTRDGLPSNYVLTTLAGPGDTLWVGTLGGGIAVRTGRRFLVVDSRDGLTDDRVNALTRDRDGNIWASTSGGLDRFHARAITTYTRADGLPDPLVWGVAGDAGGTVWLTTNAGGITRFADGRFTTWRDNPLIANSQISVIAPVADGSIWLGIRPATVARFRDGRVDDWTHRPGAPVRGVVAITQTPNGDIYFAGPGGLVRLRSGEFSTIALPGDSAARVLRVLGHDPDGTVWAAGNSLYRVRGGRAELVSAPNAFAAAMVAALLADSGRVWLSTDGGGLYLFQGGQVNPVGRPGSALLNDAFTLLDDGRGGIWLASSFGLERAEKNELIAAAEGQVVNPPVRRFDKTDGLLSTEFNSAGGSSGWRGPDGRLWLPGADGLVAVRPAVVRAPSTPPPVSIESVVADGRPLPITSEVVLPKSTRQIAIDFTSLRFRAPRQIEFRYRLVGLDSVWQDVGTRRQAFYSSLPGGSYTFQVSARDEAGNWNPDPAVVILRAVPPIQRSPWFIALVALALAGATGGAVSLRGRAVRRQARRLEAQVADRTHDLKEEVAIRQRAETQLREAHDHLERRVIERTADLERANEQLRLNQERLGLLLRQLPAVVWSSDQDQQITTAVGSGIGVIGLTPDELIGRRFDEAFDDRDLSRGLQLAHHRAMRGEPTQDRGEYRDRTFEWRVEPVRDAGGRISGTVGLALDITDQAHLREQMLQSQKMDSIGRMAGGIAHDLNNLLTAVLGFVDLSERSPSHDDLMRNLEEIRFASDRAASLTRQLLTFARRQKTSVRAVSLNDVVHSMEGLLRRLLGHDVRLATEGAPDLPTVLADPNQIEQVIVNLAVNARDAMPDGGTLTIATGTQLVARQRGDLAPGTYVRLSVRDSGIGMTDEVKARVFEPFFTTKELGKGTGLGLATSFGIVREFHGAIEIDSAPGEGTTVNVYLPAHAAAAPEPAAAGAPRQPPAGSETILLVDDETQVRVVTERALASFGYRVLSAADGVDALDVAAAYDGPIHLLLTDVRMPRMGGLELAARLMSLRPEMRILLMSGYVDVKAPPDAPQLDEAPRLMKPFRVNELAQRVRQMLDGRPPFGS
ncbi:MAG TPA: two-component regulator propeller domain-containing protein [Gemmatimonadaceae bacterium]